MFSFIEERSGAVGGAERIDEEGKGGGEGDGAEKEEDKSVYYVFFDDCIARIRAGMILILHKHF